MKIEIKVMQTAGVVGGVAALSTIAANAVTRRTNLSHAARGIAGGAVQVVGGLLVVEKYPRVGMGLLVGGITNAVTGVSTQVRLNNAIAQLDRGSTTAPASGGGTTSTSTTTPASSGTTAGLGEPRMYVDAGRGDLVAQYNAAVARR